ncbi:hypothetical protein [Streptomyces sp. NPDC127038]|uniref:hypothetical protein n=1 Tax=Streptomyces sp. NPDC127038 TaxID=3347114 RepID=UPI003656A358
MGASVEAATGLPGILFTAALAVSVCFWLLAAVGAVAVDTFDADVDLQALGMGGVPVSVALSLLTALAWLVDVGVTALFALLDTSGPTAVALHLAAPGGALLVAWRLTCLIVRPLHRLFPGTPTTRCPRVPPRTPTADAPPGHTGRGTAPPDPYPEATAPPAT